MWEKFWSKVWFFSKIFISWSVFYCKSFALKSWFSKKHKRWIFVVCTEEMESKGDLLDVNFSLKSDFSKKKPSTQNLIFKNYIFSKIRFFENNKFKIWPDENFSIWNLTHFEVFDSKSDFFCLWGFSIKMFNIKEECEEFTTCVYMKTGEVRTFAGFFIILCLVKAVMPISLALPLHPFSAFWLAKYGQLRKIYFQKLLNCF